jgi:hypothetical protein
MKKLTLILTGVLVLVASTSAQSRLFVSAGANLMHPADAAYRSLYGNQVIYPEIAAAFRVVGGLCLIGSFGQFTKAGTTPDLGLPTRSRQSYVSAGLGYLQRVSSLFCIQGGAGAAMLKYNEEALDTEVSGQKWGLMAEGGVLYMPEEGGGFFLGLKLGFLSAKVSDVAPDIAGSQPASLGGFKVSASVGIQLFGNR